MTITEDAELELQGHTKMSTSLFSSSTSEKIFYLCIKVLLS